MLKKRILEANEKTWDEVAEKYHNGATALPYWGPYKVFGNKNLLGNVRDKILLEIGFGSGLSIKYLMNKGAKKIYGLDISSEQVKIATTENKNCLDKQKVFLFKSKMEKKIKLPVKVDIVYSIYAVGWTVSPKKTLDNIYSYLKKGGLFVWSWEHPDFNRTSIKGDKVYYDYSYFDKDSYKIRRWKNTKDGVYLYPRTVAFWFNQLRDAGFDVESYFEPEPEYFSEKQKDGNSDNLYYFSKKAKMVPCTMIFVCRKP